MARHSKLRVYVTTIGIAAVLLWGVMLVTNTYFHQKRKLLRVIVTRLEYFYETKRELFYFLQTQNWFRQSLDPAGGNPSLYRGTPRRLRKNISASPGLQKGKRRCLMRGLCKAFMPSICPACFYFISLSIACLTYLIWL
jgi:hypothetical protein